jgi:hypothetical protein
MKALIALFALLLFAFAGKSAHAAPFETSAPQACTVGTVVLDHYVLHVGTTSTVLTPTTNASGQCYVHYDIGPLISGLSTSAANTLLATYTVTAANALGQESSAVPFALLPGIPAAPGAFTVTAN